MCLLSRFLGTVNRYNCNFRHSYIRLILLKKKKAPASCYCSYILADLSTWSARHIVKNITPLEDATDARSGFLVSAAHLVTALFHSIFIWTVMFFLLRVLHLNFRLRGLVRRQIGIYAHASTFLAIPDASHILCIVKNVMNWKFLDWFYCGCIVSIIIYAVI